MRSFFSESGASSAAGRALVAAVIVSAAFGTSGCKKLLSAMIKKRDAGTTVASSAMTAQDRSDEELQEKLDEYIKCLNSLSTPINQARKRYLTYIPKTGPTGREGYADIYTLPTGAAANCAAGVARAKTMPPANPALESVGGEYSEAASEVDRLVSDEHRYFEEKNFKDDHWAKGKAMHPRLIAAFNKFSSADKKLHETLDGITKPLAQRTLARIEREEGKKFRYHRKNTLIAARSLVEASDPPGDDDDVDFELYAAAYTTFEKAIDELEAYGQLHRTDLSDQKLAPSWPLADSNYDSFVKESMNYKHASKEFWRCLRDAPAKAKTPSGKLDVEKIGNCGGGPAWKSADDVIKTYNDFIQSSNTHPFP